MMVSLHVAGMHVYQICAVCLQVHARHMAPLSMQKAYN